MKMTKNEKLAHELGLALFRLLPYEKYRKILFEINAMDPRGRVEHLGPKLKKLTGTDDPSKVDFTGVPTWRERMKEAHPEAILPPEQPQI